MSAEVFDILRAAVRIARDEQVRCLAALKERLNLSHPGMESDIEEAIAFWAGHVRNSV